jgi:hypothetical protein
VSVVRQKIHIFVSMPAISSDRIKIEAQILRFDLFFMPVFFFLELEGILARKERRRGLPRRLDR